jgi:hypothetical protein
VARRQPASSINFGNYPQPVLIRGKLIACTADETQFLVTFADTPNFSLGCLPPLHP